MFTRTIRYVGPPCKYCHEVLLILEDWTGLCQARGMRTTTSTSTSSNDNSSSKDKSTLPKESKSNLKQKDSLE
jgi:hypothetical protein